VYSQRRFAGFTSILLLTFSAALGIAVRCEAAATVAKAKALEQEMNEAYRAGKFDAALSTCQKIVELFPQIANPRISMASLQAKLGKKDDAWASLDKAAELGFALPDTLAQENNIASLNEGKRFTELIERIRANQIKAAPGIYEKGAEIKGIKTVEAFPEGGLRYRIRMSESATEEKPNRLIVWLHPSGGSMNDTVEAMAPMFAKHNFALMVLTQKQFAAWTPQEISALMNQTYNNAINRNPGIARNLPVLMGYSAGGNAALLLWSQNPTKFAGMILSAAVPLDVGMRKELPTPSPEKAKDCPFFVLIGEKDGGTPAAWKDIETRWSKAGVPLTLKVVLGAGHTWLFGKTETDELDTWLGNLEKKVSAEPSHIHRQQGTDGNTEKVK